MKLSIAFLAFVSLTFSTSQIARANGPWLLPDLQTVVPHQIQLVNSQQREILRFSNGVANTGEGTLRMYSRAPLVQGAPQLAIQQILDTDGNVVEEYEVSEFEYHPAHKHFHINDVASFSVHMDSPVGPLYGDPSIKVTFCLIDWISIEGNSPNNQRTYADCFAQFQGVSPGWIDQYHQELEGQNLDITGIPPGDYYIVSTSNPANRFIESNYDNNTAYASFEIKRDSKGNPKLIVTGHSPCDSARMCGQDLPNR